MMATLDIHNPATGAKITTVAADTPESVAAQRGCAARALAALAATLSGVSAATVVILVPVAGLWMSKVAIMLRARRAPRPGSR